MIRGMLRRRLLTAPKPAAPGPVWQARLVLEPDGTVCRIFDETDTELVEVADGHVFVTIPENIEAAVGTLPDDTIEDMRMAIELVDECGIEEILRHPDAVLEEYILDYEDRHGAVPEYIRTAAAQDLKPKCLFNLYFADPRDALYLSMDGAYTTLRFDMKMPANRLMIAAVIFDGEFRALPPECVRILSDGSVSVRYDLGFSSYTTLFLSVDPPER